jgi:hypothetical protein
VNELKPCAEDVEKSKKEIDAIKDPKEKMISREWNSGREVARAFFSC